MNPNRPARLNRTVLAVLGLLLLLTGAFVLLVGSGAAPTVTARLPARADVPMLPDGFVAPAWLPWVGLAAAAVVGLAALGWLVAQPARAPATGTWQLADDPRGGTTELDTATAAAPLAEEISTYAGVRAATARLAGAHQHPSCTCASPPRTAHPCPTCDTGSTNSPSRGWSARSTSPLSTPTSSYALPGGEPTPASGSADGRPSAHAFGPSSPSPVV